MRLFSHSNCGGHAQWDGKRSEANPALYNRPHSAAPLRDECYLVESMGGAGVSVGPSFAPSGVALLDHLLKLVDDKTHGKGGMLQRAFSYLIIGAFGAVINLMVLDICLFAGPMPANRQLHWLVAFLVAAEVSILANFIPNDRITFGRLPGHARPWWLRCARFHSTTLVGTGVTLVISYSLHRWFGFLAVLAEAIAIVVALVFNFTLHHLWTYRAVGKEMSR